MTYRTQFSHRELLLVTAVFDRRVISLSVNGTVAQRSYENHELVLYPSPSVLVARAVNIGVLKQSLDAWGIRCGFKI